MNKYLVVLVALLLLAVSCDKSSAPDDQGEGLDMTEKLVGDYTYTEAYTLSVSNNKTEGTDSGSFKLTKKTPLMLEMTGDLVSPTILVNYSILTFVEKKIETSVFDGYIYYGSGQVSGETITFGYRKSGKDYSRGDYWDYYEKVSTVTAKKVKKK